MVDSRGPEVREAASEFCRFLFTAPAQSEFAKLGFRVNPRTCKEVAHQQTGLPPATLWQVGWGRGRRAAGGAVGREGLLASARGAFAESPAPAETAQPSFVVHPQQALKHLLCLHQ